MFGVFRSLPRRVRPRGFVGGLCVAGGALLASGCEEWATLRAQYLHLPQSAPPPASSACPRCATAASAETPSPEPAVVPASHQEPAEPAELPINLDTVLRLAEEQNRQVAIARERVNESLTENQLAAGCWLPNITAGGGYFRHEGGIQNEDGTLTHSSFGALFPGVQIRTELDVREATFRRVNAERQVWQNKGELSKVTYESLLEAATTYVDLLTARRGEEVTRELQSYQEDLLKRAEKADTDGSMKFLVEGIRAEVAGSRQVRAKLRQGGDAAAAKLAYLLGLDPRAQLTPVDPALTPIDLVDPTPSTDELVARAVTNGPGVRELEGLLATIQGGMAELEGPKKFLPAVELNVLEGAFGAGPGARLDWDNRLDICLQARWNLTEFLTAREKRRLAQSKLLQATLTYEDVKAKLTLGVREARDAILRGREQIGEGSETVRHASETYRLSNLRLKENAPGSSSAEVNQAIRGLQGAHLNYLQAISAYNKAQIRLLLLLGPGSCIPAK